MLKLLGVTFKVPWNHLHVGQSVFIPYLDARKTERLVQAQADARHYEVEIRHVIEGGRLGLRVWRTR